jgi:hemolysin D
MKQRLEQWIDRFEQRRARADADALASPYRAGIRSVTEAPLPRASRWLLTALVLLLVALLAWSTFGRIDVTASAQGATVVNSRVKPIQAPVRGAVSEIPVEEGDRVSADEPLLRLDDTAAAAEVRDLEGKLARARGAEARLEALLRADDASGFGPQREPAQPKIDPVEGVPETTLARAHRLLESQWYAYLDGIRELQRQRASREAQRETTRASVDAIKAVLPYLEARVERLETLSGSDAASDQDRDDARQQLVQRRRELQVERSRLKEVNTELALMEQRILVARSEFRQEMSAELSDVVAQVSSLREKLVKARDELRQHVVRSPIDGTVQDLSVHARRAVVSPDDTLMRVVPQDQPVEVEASILNRDIGFAHEGQEVDVKFQAYDFTRYGEVPGVIRKIALTSTEDKDAGRIYRALVELERHSVEVDGETIPLRPGLTATVDIDMGQRRIIEYFLEPLLRYQDEALRER